MLDILGAALDENNIPYASLHNRLKSKIFEANFKSETFQQIWNLKSETFQQIWNLKSETFQQI